MPFNWGNIWPGGKPFYTPTQTTNTQIGNPSTGTHLLHPDATKRQNEKTAAMRALIEQNPDQLGTIQNTGQVNKMSMFPPWGHLWVPPQEEFMELLNWQKINLIV